MRVAPVLLAAAFLLAAPGVAAADVIFDPADADELAATLAEATEDQDVCYGWNVQVDDAAAGRSESIGSNLGAGQPVDRGNCPKSVQLNVFITYTSESSESEDSASYDLVSSQGGPTRDDMDALELDTDSLTSDDPDVVIGKMVVAMPLLAADKGLADPIEAAPETGAAPSDAQLTDSPGSDWWRNSGGMLLWGIGLMLAGAVFAWWVVKSNRGRRGPGRFRPAPIEQVPPYIPDTVPAEFYDQDPDLAPATKEKPESTSDPDLAPATKEESAAESTSDDKPEPAEGAAPAAEPTPESTPEPTASPSEEAGEEAAAEPPSTESAEPPSDEAKKAAPEAESAADQKDKE